MVMIALHCAGDLRAEQIVKWGAPRGNCRMWKE
jgi:hypothetical protein